MLNPKNVPPDPDAPSLAPGEVRRSDGANSWAVVAALAVAGAIAMVVSSPSLEELRKNVRELFADATAPLPKPVAQPPSLQAAKPSATSPASAPIDDDRARPVSFYFARWGVTEAQSPIGWTSRIEIRAAPGGGPVAKIWVTCPTGHCEAGEFPIAPVAHLQKKEMTAYLSMQRRDGDRQWTLLLRPAPGRPDELERWEWYGPFGTNTRTQSVQGHIRRMRADGTFH